MNNKGNKGNKLYNNNCLFVLMKLGSGTYGKVYTSQNNKYAIKQIHFENLHSALKEIIILRSIDHPNVIKIHKIIPDFAKYNLNMYMDLYQYDLDTFRLNYNNFHIDLEIMIKECVEQIFSALHYLHKHKIFHRDLTPGNILVKKNSPINIPRFKYTLCDFGLSGKKFFDTQTTFETSICTVTYRAPEIYTKVEKLKYNETIDIWSFGCLIYYIIVGDDLIDNYMTNEKYPNSESSVYICDLFNIPISRNHLTRLRRLKNVPFLLRKNILTHKLQNSHMNRIFDNDSENSIETDDVDYNNLKKVLINKYIDLITECLETNYTIRPNTSQLYNKYPTLLSINKNIEKYGNYQLNDEIWEKCPKKYFDLNYEEIPIVDYEPNSVLDQDILDFAKYIYTKYLNLNVNNKDRNKDSNKDRNKDSNKNKKSNKCELYYQVTIYISALLLEKEFDCKDIFNEDYDIHLISYAILDILNKIDWII